MNPKDLDQYLEPRLDFREKYVGKDYKFDPEACFHQEQKRSLELKKKENVVEADSKKKIKKEADNLVADKKAEET